MFYRLFYLKFRIEFRLMPFIDIYNSWLLLFHISFLFLSSKQIFIKDRMKRIAFCNSFVSTFTQGIWKQSFGHKSWPCQCKSNQYFTCLPEITTFELKRKLNLLISASRTQNYPLSVYLKNIIYKTLLK